MVSCRSVHAVSPSGQSIRSVYQPVFYGGNSVAAALSILCQGPKHADGMTALGWDWTGWVDVG